MNPFGYLVVWAAAAAAYEMTGERWWIVAAVLAVAAAVWETVERTS